MKFLMGSGLDFHGLLGLNSDCFGSREECRERPLGLDLPVPQNEGGIGPPRWQKPPVPSPPAFDGIQRQRLPRERSIEGAQIPGKHQQFPAYLRLRPYACFE